MCFVPECHRPNIPEQRCAGRGPAGGAVCVPSDVINPRDDGLHGLRSLLNALFLRRKELWLLIAPTVAAFWELLQGKLYGTPRTYSLRPSPRAFETLGANHTACPAATKPPSLPSLPGGARCLATAAATSASAARAPPTAAAGRAGRADAGLGQTVAEPLVPVSAEALQLEWVGSEALRASEGLEDASRSRSSFPGGGHPAPGSPCCLLGRREGVGSKAAPEGDGGRRERERRLLHVLGRCRLELGVLDAVLRHPAGADHSVVQLPPLPAADADTWHLLQEQAWLALHGPLRAALLLLRVRPAHPPRHFLQLLRAARLRGMPEEGRPAFPLQGNRDEERRWSPQLYATPLDQRQCPALQPLHGVQAAVRHAAQALWLQVLRWRLAFCEKVCCHFCAVFTAVLLEHVATKTVWKNLKGKWVLVSNFTHRLRRRLLCLLVLLFAFLCHDTLATIWLHVD